LKALGVFFFFTTFFFVTFFFLDKRFLRLWRRPLRLRLLRRPLPMRYFLRLPDRLPLFFILFLERVRFFFEIFFLAELTDRCVSTLTIRFSLFLAALSTL